MLVVGKRKMKISQMALRIVLILIFLRIFFYFLPLEFSNTDAQVFMRIGFNALIIVVFFIFFIMKIIIDKSINLFIKVLLSITSITIFGLGLMLFSFLGFMCNEVNGDNYYVRNDGQSMIKSRVFDCGATTNTEPSDYKLKKVTKIGQYFNWVTSTDTTNIDKNEWAKVKL
jgi:hypothetical protein